MPALTMPWPRLNGIVGRKQRVRPANMRSADDDQSLDDEAFIVFPSWWRLFLMFALCCGAVSTCLYLAGAIGDDPMRGWELTWWIFAFVFGLMALLWMRRLLVRGPYLQIDAEGIVYGLISNRVIPWRDIGRVKRLQIVKNRYIAVILRNPEAHLNPIQRRLAAFQYQTVGADLAISVIGTNGDIDQAMAAIDHFGKKGKR
jgi:hypothetical protein